MTDEVTVAAVEDGTVLSRFPLVAAARSTSRWVLENSSSGGLFFELARATIAAGGVVYGCAHDERLHARHIRCDTLGACEACMGSKYVQSDMGDVFVRVRSDLEEGREVLFSGTPCQAAAVRAFIGENPLLVTVDIICHGTPSPGVFEAWLTDLEKMKGKKILRYDHRPKNKGWQHLERITWEDGTIDQDSNLGVAWKYLFYGDRMLRPSCYRCPFTTIKRPSDITIGDYWKIDQTDAADIAGELGISAVLINSETGKGLFDRADLLSKASSIEDVIPGNPMLTRPTGLPVDREELWVQLYEEGLVSMMRDRRYLVSPLRHKVGSLKRKLMG